MKRQGTYGPTLLPWFEILAILLIYRRLTLNPFHAKLRVGDGQIPPDSPTCPFVLQRNELKFFVIKRHSVIRSLQEVRMP